MAVAARRILPTAFAAVLLTAMLSGCSLQQLADLVPHAETRDDDGSITAGGTTDVFTLRQGDCLDDAALAAVNAQDPDDALPAGDTDARDRSEVSDVSTVPCSAPHDFEVYAALTIPGGAFPGDDAVSTQADDLCGGAFGPFVGFDYQDSIYDYQGYQPTSDSWSTGDRAVTCVIGDPAGKTVGSLAGIGR
ncbi:septum formation family protein [Clavibacter sp. VKM Ac-2873]|uniref:septum formation family protein n=1 Tax=Clavibacter sp. VKM Ac-2873 TaxID=2783813 RepID=UPI00188C7E0A|nr:septum formation family protein [Clavibacter sp. VKM Ac-2873]MBF4618459.1 septum formation family protein [Clavibacter sp. VKM Ac-2873]